MNNKQLATKLTVALVAGLYLGCSSSTLPTPPVSENRTVQVTEEVNGTQINLIEGDTLLVTLESNPSTGYRWEIDAIAPEVLQQVGEPLFQPSSNQLGAGGTETFRFFVVGTGASVLRLFYRRPFEDEDPLEIFSLRVVSN
jgi:inhibitor of cysteine peptidase